MSCGWIHVLKCVPGGNPFTRCHSAEYQRRIASKTPNNLGVSSEVLEWRAAGWQQIIGHGLAPWIVCAAAMHQICKLAAQGAAPEFSHLTIRPTAVQPFSANLTVETGHLPSWPFTEMRRP